MHDDSDEVVYRWFPEGFDESTRLVADGGWKPPGDEDAEDREAKHHEEVEFEKDLRMLRDEHLEVLDDLRVKHRELKDAHLTELDDLMGRYEQILEKRDIAEELREDYEDVLDEHIDLLDDLAREERQGSVSKIFWGAGAIAAGLLSAELYLPTENIIDFYSDSVSIYVDSPEMAAITLGLPAAGLYGFAKAYENRSNYNELKRELREYKLKREEL